jgi:vWA-MoxR associated protein C-terminal domain/vWA-MoxR associated protein middle region 0
MTGGVIAEPVRDRIVEAFFGIDLMRQVAGRQMCAQLVAEELGEGVPGARGRWTDRLSRRRTADDEDRGAVAELVDWLLGRDVAIWIFVETLGEIHDPCRELDDLRAAVQVAVAQPLLVREQRRELHRVCSGIVCDHVQELLGLSAPSFAGAFRAESGGVLEALNELEELPARNGESLLPLTMFVEYLAAEQQPEARDRLHEWNDSVVRPRLRPALHVFRNELSPVYREAGPETSVVRLDDQAPKCLIVRLDTDQMDHRRYLVSILFQDGRGDLMTLCPPDDDTHTEAEVRELIGKALNRPLVAETPAGRLMVEFVLRSQLINRPVDQWTVGTAPAPLGLKYPVVVRSLDRAEDMLPQHGLWRAKWARREEVELADEPSGHGFEWSPRDPGETDRQLYVRLSENSLPVCLPMMSTPDAAQCGNILAALDAGVPVMLWSRRPDVDLRTGLTTLLPIRLAELPWRVLGFRREAEGDENHLARHLTLLWDDADRVPLTG